LESWSAEWKHKPELKNDLMTGDGHQFRQIALGDTLREALQYGQSWYFDGFRRNRLVSLCWTDDCRRSYAPGPLKVRVVRIRVLKLMYGDPLFTIGNYDPGSFERFLYKLAQFPAGSIFGWCTEREGISDMTQAQVAALRQKVKSTVESQGFVFLANPPKGTCFTER
jgi:hypothetical protein